MRKFLVLILCFICLFGIYDVKAEESEVQNPNNEVIDNNINDNNSNDNNSNNDNINDDLLTEETDLNDNINNETIEENEDYLELENITDNINNQKEEIKKVQVNEVKEPVTINSNLTEDSSISITSDSFSYSTKVETIIDIKISNIDISTNEQLVGSKLCIKDEKDDVVYEWKSTKETYIATDLKEGVYYLVVLNTPEGYEAKEEKIKFIVASGDEEKEIIVENVPVVVVPDTLSSGTILLLSIAMIDIAIGIWIVIYVKNSKIKE